MVSVTVEEAIIRGVVGSSILQGLLHGIYTAAYIGALYITFTRKSSVNYWVTGAITSLYILNTVIIASAWFTDLKTLGINAPPWQIASEYALSVSDPDLTQYIQDICKFLLVVIADCLIIWRCYKIWGNSITVISVPMILVLAETALYLANIIITKINATQKKKLVANWLEISALFAAVTTTLITTLLIVFRIHSLSRQNAVPNGWRRYAPILNYLIQSCALHVVGLLLFAIPDAFYIADAHVSKAKNALTYGGSFFPFTAGLAPTLMIWCIALSSDSAVHKPLSPAISRMEFHVKTTSIHAPQTVSINTAA